MFFSQYLKNQLDSYNTTQTDLVGILHTVHPTLSSLDTITLNRWLNNKTTPPKDKQIVIARFFERDLKNYISLVAPPSIPKSFMSHYNKIFTGIESSYSAIGYDYSSEQKTIKLERISRRESRRKLDGFYSNIEGYRKVFEINGSSTLDLPTTLLTINQGERVVSHLSFQDDIDKTMSALSEVIGRKVEKKSKTLLSNIGYYSSREHYQLIVGHMFNNILDEYSEYRYLYSLTRGQKFLQMMQLLGGELMHSKREPITVGNCHLVRFTIDKLIAHPFILNEIYKTRASYQELIKTGQLPF